MFTDNNNGLFMPVAPAYGGYNNGFGGFGGDLILLAILFACGFGGFGGWGGMGGYGGGLGIDFPWLMNGQQQVSNNATNGFRDQMLNTTMQGIQSSVGDVKTALYDVQNSIGQQMNTNQIASLERSFAEQTANMQGMNGIQSQLAQCCCENRAATADVKYTIANEAAATRAEDSNNTQKIMDKLCQLELDGVRQNYENRIAGMQNALDQSRANEQALRFAASLGAQTSTIISNNDAQTTALEQYLAPTPRPAYIVQNPNCCGNNYGFGGCGNFAA